MFRADFRRLFQKEEYEQVVKSDYAIVLGCDTEHALKRADYAAEFYHREGTQKLIVSGGVERSLGEKKMPEYQIMRDRLIEKGVPENAILLETQAKDTIQNMLNSATVISNDRYIMKVKNITIITEAYHLPRALITAKLFLPRIFNVYGFSVNCAEQVRESMDMINTELGFLRTLIVEEGLEPRDISSYLALL